MSFKELQDGQVWLQDEIQQYNCHCIVKSFETERWLKIAAFNLALVQRQETKAAFIT